MHAHRRPTDHLLTFTSLGLAAWLASASCMAQPAPVTTPVTTPVTAPVTGPAEAALLQALGQREGLTSLVGDFVDRAVVDPRTGPFFKEVKPAHLKQQIRDQICQMLGGGCVYDGDTMKQSHASLKIGRPDFLALVEVLQDSMDARGIPFAAQNQLLARLAPMHRDIVTR